MKGQSDLEGYRYRPRARMFNYILERRLLKLQTREQSASSHKLQTVQLPFH